MMKLLKFSLALSLLLVFNACDSKRYFEQNQEIEDTNWYYKDGREFSFAMNDTTSLFNFYINVRNTLDYPYANLYVFINSEFPDKEMARDTIELQLAQTDGKWLGSGYGNYKYHQFILRKGMRFVQTGIYNFTIEQGMRDDTLKGIADIGIRLEYAK